MPTTWNPSDKAAGVTLSGGNLIASGSGGVRATNSLSGLNYFEIKVNSGASNAEPFFALITAAVSLTTTAGGNGYLIAYNGTDIEAINASTGATDASFTATLANGDVIGLAVNTTTSRLYVSRNGTFQIGNPVAGTGGLTLAAGTYFPGAFVGFAGGSSVAALQADTTTYSPPTGYSLIASGSGAQTLTGTLFNSGDTFGAGTIQRGTRTLTGTLFAPANTFGAGVVTRSISLVGTLFSEADAFGAGTLNVGPVTLTGTLYSDADAFGAGAISQSGGLQTLTGTLFSDGDAFGSGSIVQAGGPQTLTGALYTDADAFGAGSLSTGPVSLAGTLYSDPDAFGAGSVNQVGGPQTITGTLFVDPDGFGSGAVVQPASGGQAAASGSTNKIAWWRGYSPVRLTARVKDELAEEIAQSLPASASTVTQAEIAKLDLMDEAFARLSLDTRAAQDALVRDLVAKVNAHIQAMEQDDEEAILLLA